MIMLDKALLRIKSWLVGVALQGLSDKINKLSKINNC